MDKLSRMFSRFTIELFMDNLRFQAWSLQESTCSCVLVCQFSWRFCNQGRLGITLPLHYQSIHCWELKQSWLPEKRNNHTPLYPCHFYKVREVFPLPLKKGLCAFFLQLKLLLEYWFSFSQAPSCSWSLIIYHGLSLRSSCLGMCSGCRAPAKPQQPLSDGNSSSCQSRLWIVCCHRSHLRGRSLEFREVLLNS